jgi:hypothetical protein
VIGTGLGDILIDVTNNKQQFIADLAPSMSRVFSNADHKIALAFHSGWSLPKGICARLKNQEQRNNTKPQDRFNKLFQQFVDEINFPEGWTVIEKIILLDDILRNRRDECGNRIKNSGG